VPLPRGERDPLLILQSTRAAVVPALLPHSPVTGQPNQQPTSLVLRALPHTTVDVNHLAPPPDGSAPRFHQSLLCNASALVSRATSTPFP
jgi:hypothetical protein